MNWQLELLTESALGVLQGYLERILNRHEIFPEWIMVLQDAITTEWDRRDSMPVVSESRDDVRAIELQLRALVEEAVEIEAALEFSRCRAPKRPFIPDEAISIAEYQDFLRREADADRDISIHNELLRRLEKRADEIERALGRLIPKPIRVRVPAFHDTFYVIWCGENSYRKSGYNVTFDPIWSNGVR